MLETYILKAEHPINQNLFDFLIEFLDSARKSDLLCRKNRESAENSLLGELMAKYAIKKHFGIPFQNQHFSREEHGKPYLDGYPHIHFSISHCEDYVACAVSDHPVGIDIQKIVEYKYRVAKRICSENELLRINGDGDKFTKLWTRKEAVLKLRGTGFTDSDIKNCLESAIIHTEKLDNCYISVSYR